MAKTRQSKTNDAPLITTRVKGGIIEVVESSGAKNVFAARSAFRCGQISSVKLDGLSVTVFGQFAAPSIQFLESTRSNAIKLYETFIEVIGEPLPPFASLRGMEQAWQTLESAKLPDADSAMCPRCHGARRSGQHVCDGCWLAMDDSQRTGMTKAIVESAESYDVLYKHFKDIMDGKTSARPSVAAGSGGEYVSKLSSGVLSGSCGCREDAAAISETSSKASFKCPKCGGLKRSDRTACMACRKSEIKNIVSKINVC